MTVIQGNLSILCFTFYYMNDVKRERERRGGGGGGGGVFQLRTTDFCLFVADFFYIVSTDYVIKIMGICMMQHLTLLYKWALPVCLCP